MSHDPSSDIMASVRERLQQELEVQLRAIAQHHEDAQAEAVAQARREAEVEAEQRWSARLQTARAETQQQVEAAVAAMRTELEGEAAAASARDAEQGPRASSLLEDVRRVDAAASISDTLAALVRSAAGRAGRAALFVANGPHLDEWTVAGVPSLGIAHHEGATGALLEQALQSAAVVRGSDGAFAAPLLLDNVAVGVLYGAPGAADASDDWVPALEVLTRHGAAHLAYLTALRTAQARQWLDSARQPSAQAAGSSGSSEEEQAAARRYARLLVSEIKLYNDAAVRTGRQQRDLLRRLGPEIERARRVYEERVPAHVAGRAQHFQHELVQTLAGGDPSLLN